MRILLRTDFAALFARAGVSRAGFVSLTGLTARQVTNWCHGRAALRPCATAFAVILEQHSPQVNSIRIDEITVAWRETLGIAPNATAETVRLAMRRLVLRYHRDQGGFAEALKGPTEIANADRHAARPHPVRDHEGHELVSATQGYLPLGVSVLAGRR
jgi:hypothetical protein